MNITTITPVKIILTPSKNLEILKQKARKLKKEEGLPHHEALDQIAKKFHYHHWHHVTEMAAITEPSETAHNSGLLAAFDVKEAESFNHELFKEDHIARFFCEKELWDTFLEMDDEEDDFQESESEQQEYFHDFIENLVFYRYTKKELPDDIEKALMLINEYSFWPPMYVWLKGKFYDTTGAPVTDNDGNIVGVRF